MFNSELKTLLRREAIILEIIILKVNHTEAHGTIRTLYLRGKGNTSSNFPLGSILIEVFLNHDKVITRNPPLLLKEEDREIIGDKVLLSSENQMLPI